MIRRIHLMIEIPFFDHDYFKKQLPIKGGLFGIMFSGYIVPNDHYKRLHYKRLHTYIGFGK